MKKGYVFLLTIVFISYMGFQVYNAYVNGMTTEKASLVSLSETVSLDGILFRTEKVLEGDKDSFVYSLVSEGDKVSVGEKIAVLYSTLDDVDKMIRADEIDEKIDSLTAIEKAARSGGIDYYAVKATVDDKIKEMIYSVKSDHTEALFDEKKEIDLLIAKKDMVAGLKKDFSAEKQALEAEKDNLLKGMGTKKGELKASISGYFSTHVDGYEEAVDINELKRLTPVAFRELTNLKPTEKNAVGKIITNFEWYYAALVSEEEGKRFAVGQSVVIEPESLNVSAKAEVVSISEPENNFCVLLFKSGRDIDKIASLRQATCSVALKDYFGIRVPKDAIRVVDGKRGVFVLTGAKAQFKEIEVLLDGEDFVVAKENTSDKNSLLLYDEIIIKGKNLYDGKVVE